MRPLLLFSVLLIALAVRLIFISRFPMPPPYNDLLWNDAVGWNLAQGHGFTASQQEPRVPGVFRTPGYPAFLAAIYGAFGHAYGAVYRTHALCDAATAVLIALIAAQLVSPGTGLLAGMLYALYPYSAIYCGVLHQDILLTFSVQLVLFLTIMPSSRTRSGVKWFLVGLATGGAALVKAVMLLLAAVPALSLLLEERERRRRAFCVAALGLGILLPIVPWEIRNYLTFGTFVPLAVGGTGTNLRYLVEELQTGEIGSVMRFVTDPSAQPTPPDQFVAAIVDGKPLIAHERELAAAASRVLLQRWPDYLLLIVRHVPQLWITRYTRGQSPFVLLVAQTLAWTVVLAGTAGMLVARRQWRRLFPLYATVFWLTVLHAPYTAEARYTLPARPAMIVFVAVACLRGLAALRDWRKRNSATG